ncbi:hypothetical protein psyc5s11_30050 [Clostridium gelidum]|uniref:SbsA Ig-like domain-containing protein n=1 Tax=Clostridium gelidum TaxID=704125 RepID=A0ABM7TD89_9CLOT|nr:Ig-like domain-containing protein [Clostridium gelidum]BCZ46938.1 hypothetical protein psyc5s11_30050 [Clostridium gelidum]
MILIVLRHCLEPLHPSTPPADGGSVSGIPGVVGGTVTDSNSDVGVSITTNIKWTFAKAINQDEVEHTNFMVTKVSDSSAVEGTLTIDDTKKIVTFIPNGIATNTTYAAIAEPVLLLDGSGSTTAISVKFTTL